LPRWVRILSILPGFPGRRKRRCSRINKADQ
jgi:hypothetical protein